MDDLRVEIDVTDGIVSTEYPAPPPEPEEDRDVDD
jgi:hypothetical protein